MKTKNNLFDQLETVKDGKLYAVNIHLKSGQIVHLEHLEKSEKDAYVNYVRMGNEKMLIETKTQVWRLLPDDIEKLEVKAYNVQQANSVYPFMRFLLSRSRLQTSTFTQFFIYFILLLLSSILIQVVRAVIEVGPAEVLISPSEMFPYLLGSTDLFVKGAWILVGIMFVLNIVDFILKPTEKFYILDDGRRFLEGTKVLHLLITLACFIGVIIVNSVISGILARFIG